MLPRLQQQHSPGCSRRLVLCLLLKSAHPLHPPSSSHEAVMSIFTLWARAKRSSDPGSDRRTVQRCHCARQTSCRSVKAGNEETAPAVLEDVSTEGLRLVGPCPYEPGRVLAVSWHQPAGGPKQTVLAHVI